MKTLLVVDGNSIVNRAYFGIRPLSTSRGTPTNAVYGFISILDRYLKAFSPDAAVVAFDVHAPTFRHKMTDTYKATRKPMPEDLCLQMPYAKRAAQTLGFVTVEREGYEADDILGTYSRLGEEAGMRVILLTGDRDSFQLISEGTSVVMASTGDSPLVDVAAFREKYGVLPSQFVDVKAIMGDSSDNIPGVAGIGEKGALELIGRFSDLDGVYAAADDPSSDIKPKMREKLIAGKESAYLSRTLATIFREVEVPPVSDLPAPALDRAEARRLFTELEFGAFIRKFRLDEPDAAPVSAAPAEGTVLSEDLSAALTPGTAFFLDGERILLTGEKGNFTAAASRDNLALVAAHAAELTVYDAKSLIRAFSDAGVRVDGFGYDVMLAAYVADPQSKTALPDLVTSVLGEVMRRDVPASVYVRRLREFFDGRLDEGAKKLLADIEMPLSGVLARMEEYGFLIDTAWLSEYGKKLEEKSEGLKYRIWGAAGIEFNINSPKQLGDVLFGKMGLPHGKKTSNGYSTSAEILEKLAPVSPVVSDILEYRKLTKLLGTYVQGLIKVADKEGAVHTSFRQTGTATGRLSSAEPNLQNIPVRTPEGRELRRAFTARPGHLLIDADYSQIELRLLAAISGDERMISAFSSGMDIHASTAAAVFGIPESEVTPELRKRAKAVNFGIVYGIGEYSLSQDLGISVKQAKDYIESYLATYPAVSAYLDGIVEQAKRDGYVDTLYGRRRYIPEISAKNGMLRKFGERVAMNSPIQGTAADIIKIAMINVDRRLKEEGLDARLILQVHDELIIDSDRACADKAATVLREEMENAARLPVALSVELTTGERWLM